MSLITETNQQYYQGAQIFVVPATATGQEFTIKVHKFLLYLLLLLGKNLPLHLTQI